MNIVLITAGGNGARMNQDIPKQFLCVMNKPIIIYTLEAFQRHSDIDIIAVVCIDGWEKILYAYAKQFNITKLRHVVCGGNCGQASIRNGLLELEKHYKPDDIVLIHDSNRPMVTQDIISDCIVKTNKYGAAIVSIPCAEAILETEDAISSDMSHPREKLRRTQTPQGFTLGKIIHAHKKALEMGIYNSVAACTLMVETGEAVYFSKGSEKNIKITTTDDLDIFVALLNSKREE